MNKLALTCMLGAAIVGGALSAAAQVAAPEAREAVLQRAERFEVDSPAEIAGRFEHIVDPFYPASGMDPEEGQVAADLGAPPPPSDRVILDSLAERIRPSGVMRFGSQIHLLFGERRIKPGDFISVTYQGSEYNLELVKVDGQTFTLRLNEEVISKRIQ